eukprot:SAG31_NODE_175_length_21352_cov_3.981508_7_plen_692_part_00
MHVEEQASFDELHDPEYLAGTWPSPEHMTAHHDGPDLPFFDTDEDVHHAATQVQAAWRGNATRKEFKASDFAAQEQPVALAGPTLSSHTEPAGAAPSGQPVEMDAADARIPHAEIQTASTLISDAQAEHRVYMQDQEECLAAKKIQATARGNQSRRRTLQVKQQAAATKLQSVQRGKAARRHCANVKQHRLAVAQHKAAKAAVQKAKSASGRALPPLLYMIAAEHATYPLFRELLASDSKSTNRPHESIRPHAPSRKCGPIRNGRPAVRVKQSTAKQPGPAPALQPLAGRSTGAPLEPRCRQTLKIVFQQAAADADYADCTTSNKQRSVADVSASARGLRWSEFARHPFVKSIREGCATAELVLSALETKGVETLPPLSVRSWLVFCRRLQNQWLSEPAEMSFTQWIDKLFNEFTGVQPLHQTRLTSQNHSEETLKLPPISASLDNTQEKRLKIQAASALSKLLYCSASSTMEAAAQSYAPEGCRHRRTLDKLLPSSAVSELLHQLDNAIVLGGLSAAALGPLRHRLARAEAGRALTEAAAEAATSIRSVQYGDAIATITAALESASGTGLEEAPIGFELKRLALLAKSHASQLRTDVTQAATTAKAPGQRLKVEKEDPPPRSKHGYQERLIAAARESPRSRKLYPPATNNNGENARRIVEAHKDLYRTCGTRVILDVAVGPPDYGYNFMG